MAKYQKMLSTEESIERAVEFLKGIKPEFSGFTAKNIRLEEAQHTGSRCTVALSFESDFSEEIASHRIIKEVTINAKNGKILAFLNGDTPPAPAPIPPVDLETTE